MGFDEMMQFLFDRWGYIEVGRFRGDAKWFCRNKTDEGIGGIGPERCFEGETPSQAVENAYWFEEPLALTPKDGDSGEGR